MGLRSRLIVFAVVVCLVAIPSPVFAVENSAGPAPNSDFTYQQLRNLGLSGEAVSVNDLMLKYNLDASILQDVLSTAPGGLFVAFVHGKRYNDREIFVIDPHGAPPLILPVDPEEVELITYDENKLGVWASFHFSSEYKN